MKIIELEEVDSTNEFLKRGGFCEDTVVTAKRQTAGRGTKGRSFVSEDGGLYLSTLRFYDNFLASDAFRIMVNCSVAVCRTLEKFGVPAVIKWANDVLVGGRKICGTLIENTFSNGYITRSIVGTGVNVNNEIPPDLKDIAVSMREFSGKTFSVESVREELVKNMRKTYSIADYTAYIDWFGREVTLKTDEGEKRVTALGVTEEGRLLVDWCGNMLEISSAEVSLRL